MKHWQGSRRLFSYIFIIPLSIVPVLFVSAGPAEDLSYKIQQNSGEIAKLEKEIEQFQKELDSLGKQKASLNTSLLQLDITRKKLEADIAVTNKKIEKTNLKIKSLSSDIGIKSNLIANDTEAIKQGLKNISETEDQTLLESILSNEDFTTVWNDVDSIMSLREKLEEKIIELKQIKGQLEDTRDETVVAKNELLSLKKELADQKKIVEQNTNEKKKLLAKTKNNEALFQKNLKDNLAKKEALEKEIDDYESQLKYILDPSQLPSGNVLSWPLGYVYITSGYGTRWGSVHRGVDFRASVGTKVMAMADGVISGTGDTDASCPGASFGKFILIKYNNGLASTYGHLSLVSVSRNQKVKRGEVVGYSGNTGYSTGPHLHVSIYPKDAVDVKTIPSKSCMGKTLTQPIAPTDAYIDPMKYLPIYKK